jgi:hypothetical protein
MINKEHYPKLNPEPVTVDIGGTLLNLPRKMIAASYAGAYAAKECLIHDMHALLGDTSFKEEYEKAMPGCISAANSLGTFAVADTIEHFNPAQSLNYFIRDLIQHKDNPCYPFFEED